MKLKCHMSSRRWFHKQSKWIFWPICKTMSRRSSNMFRAISTARKLTTACVSPTASDTGFPVELKVNRRYLIKVNEPSFTADKPMCDSCGNLSATPRDWFCVNWLLYRDRQFSESSPYHNVVFGGVDKQGTVRHRYCRKGWKLQSLHRWKQLRW